MKRHSVLLTTRKMPNPVREASHLLVWLFPRDKRQQGLAKSVEGGGGALYTVGEGRCSLAQASWETVEVLLRV